MRRCFVLMGLAILAAAPALPDVIDVTVNGYISGLGTAANPCSIVVDGCILGQLVMVGYSFSETVTQLGAFSDSGGATTPFGGSAEGYADLNTTATTNALEIDLTGGHTSYHSYTDAWEEDMVAVNFDLTEPSVLELVASVGVGYPTPNYSGELLDSNGNVILADLFNVPSSNSTVLSPGMYEFNIWAAGESYDIEPPNMVLESLDFAADLNATFAPVPTPEPRGTVFAVAFAMITACCLVSRRRDTS